MKNQSFDVFSKKYWKDPAHHARRVIIELVKIGLQSLVVLYCLSTSSARVEWCVVVIVRGNIWELVVIFGNHFLIVFPKNMHQNERNEVGYPSQKVGENFWMALEEIHTLGGLFSPKRGNYSNIFEIMWAQSKNFLQVPLEIFPQAFWRGTQRNFPHFHS